MIRRLCARLGLNYIWGNINFAAGVALGAGVAGFVRGVI
jgi:hypothetical protein